MISVLLPTRGRVRQLQESMESLLFLAEAAWDVEIMLAVDPDDEATLYAMEYEEQPEQLHVWYAPERYGYKGLHHYINELAGRAHGEWLMLWNDDARMMTEDWDTIIEEAQRTVTPPGGVLWMMANHDQGGNLFPVWPRAWHTLMGYTSASPNNDVWISEIGRRLGVERRIPVRVFHDRADITGNNLDDTFNEGRAQMGQGNDDGYDSMANRLARSRAVRRIGKLYGP